MKLLKNLRMCTSNQIQNIRFVLQKNYKIEIISLIFIIGMLVLKNINTWSFVCDKITIWLSEYITKDILSLAVGVIAMFIGIYMTVWSVFATSVSKMTRLVLDRKIDEQIYLVILLNSVFSLIAIIVLVFINNTLNISVYIQIFFLIIPFVSFGKFIFVIFEITKMTSRDAISEIDRTEADKLKLNLILEDIKNQLENKTR